MGWATGYIHKLREGHVVQFRPRGRSMTGKVDDGALVTVKPLADHVIEKGDVVLCKVGGREFLHLVTAVRHGGTYQISNNHGHVNGWVGPHSIYGICVSVEK